VKLSQPLLGPPGHDQLARGLAAGVVLKVTIRTRLSVAARPDTDVDGENRLVIRAAVLGQRPKQGFDVESTLSQRIIETASPRRWVACKLKCGSKVTGPAVSRASPGSNKALAR
jgi:hypothetical protein